MSHRMFDDLRAVLEGGADLGFENITINAYDWRNRGSRI